MSQKPVQLQIPFASLVNAIASLGFEEKRRLRQLLDEEIAQAEKDQSSQRPSQGEPNLISQTVQGQDGKNISYETSGEILSLEEMKSRYPDQWLLIGEPEVDEDLNIIQGQVLAYSTDEYEIYNALPFLNVKSKAIEYTGSIPEDLTVLM